MGADMELESKSVESAPRIPYHENFRPKCGPLELDWQMHSLVHFVACQQVNDSNASVV
jgi:hypothetical protein